MGTETPTTSYLLLSLADEHFALSSTCAREIARWRTPTPVPGAPPEIIGIINQRGVILPVVQMCTLLGLATTPPGRSSRYLIMRYRDIDLALFVDAIIDLVDLSHVEPEPVPTTLDPQRARLLQGIVRLDDQLVALLDLAEIVAMLHAEA